MSLRFKLWHRWEWAVVLACLKTPSINEVHKYINVHKRRNYRPDRSKFSRQKVERLLTAIKFQERIYKISYSQHFRRYFRGFRCHTVDRNDLNNDKSEQSWAKSTPRRNYCRVHPGWNSIASWNKRRKSRRRKETAIIRRRERKDDWKNGEIILAPFGNLPRKFNPAIPFSGAYRHSTLWRGVLFFCCSLCLFCIFMKSSQAIRSKGLGLVARMCRELHFRLWAFLRIWYIYIYIYIYIYVYIPEEKRQEMFLLDVDNSRRIK